MSRRTQRSDLEFGSDSFLDVVCNIVGILIILIVVVGVRVQRQPRQPVTPPVATAQTGAPDGGALLRQQQSDAMAAATTRNAELLQQQQTLAVDSEQLEDDLQQTQSQARELETEIAAAEQQSIQKAADTEQRSRRSRQIDSERAAIQARIASLAKSLESAGGQRRDLEAALVKVKDKQQQAAAGQQQTLVETLKLQELLEDLQSRTQPANRLEHRLSPVTRAVEADEYHFRLQRGLVSRIPLDELLERLKAQVLSRRSAILKFNQFEGTVGPVGGYSMKYSVEKDGPSALEALQTGDGRIRINVSRWEILPEDSRLEEPVESAVQPGSRFREQLETCPPDAVVTLWVYEDSFASFPAIRELAHSLSLRIAARPLPVGSPIIGSPNGSRSTAQ